VLTIIQCVRHFSPSTLAPNFGLMVLRVCVFNHFPKLLVTLHYGMQSAFPTMRGKKTKNY